MNKVLSHYMLSIGLLFGSLFTAPQLLANENWNWQTYKNGISGLEMPYPAGLLEIMPEADSKISRGFQNADRTVTLVALSSVNLFDDAASYRTYLMDQPNYKDVTYKPSGSGWFVLSGYRGDNIFYEKYVFSDDRLLFQGFIIEYDKTQKETYNAVTAHISKSFRYSDWSH